MITILEKFLTGLERGVGGGVVKAITRTASAVKNRFLHTRTANHYVITMLQIWSISVCYGTRRIDIENIVTLCNRKT